MSNFGKGPVTPRPKTIMDHGRFKLHGELNSDGKRPSFHPYLHINSNDPSKNSPRIVVYTNVEADKASKSDQIQGELDIIHFKGFIAAIKDAANPAIKFTQEVIELRNYIWMNGQRSEEPKTKGYLIVGRSEIGAVYVSLKHFDTRRTACRFEFGYGVYAKHVSNEGPVEPAITSRRAAVAYAEYWDEYMMAMYKEHTTLPIPKQPQGFGGNGGGFGGQKQGGFGGGQQGGGFAGGYSPQGGQGGYNQADEKAFGGADDNLMF